MSTTWIRLLLLSAVVCGTESALRTHEYPDQDNVVDGIALATVHTQDSDTSQTMGRSKRDIEAIATGSPARTPIFLHLTTGQRLNMTLYPRAIDTSGGKLVVLNEDGTREEMPLPSADCIFSGPLTDREGFANLAMCGGEVMGSVFTDDRVYDIRTFPDLSNPHDTLPVLVTWRNSQQRESDSDNMTHNVQDETELQTSEEEDGLQIPEDGDEESDDRIITRRVTVRTNRKKKRAVLEIADILDEHYVNNLKERWGFTKEKQMLNFIFAKWSGSAAVLSSRSQVGWDITLRLVNVEIWKKNPRWYKTSPDDNLRSRLRMLCKRLKNKPYDHVMLHTSEPINERHTAGRTWLNGACEKRFNCAASRNTNINHRVELHEFGHSLGLRHDHEEPECVDDSDPDSGFMGGNPYHFRRCYKQVVERLFSSQRKDCLFQKNFANEIKRLD